MPDWKSVYLSYSGRISRKTYWLFSVPLFAIFVLNDIYVRGYSELIYLVIFFAVVILSIMLNIQRCHDRGRSGWFSLLLLVPIVSLWPMIELCFIKGNDHRNEYGGPVIW